MDSAAKQAFMKVAGLFACCCMAILDFSDVQQHPVPCCQTGTEMLDVDVF